MRHILASTKGMALAVAIAGAFTGAMAQTPQFAGDKASPPIIPTTQASDPLVSLNFPPNTPLSALISYVSERLGINFLYDETAANQPITLRSPIPVRQSQLLDVLSNVLQTKNLILEDTNVADLKRIVPAQMALTVPPVIKTDAADAAGAPGNQMVTRFCALKHVRAEQVLPLVTPMLSKPASRCAVLPDKQALVITDYAANVQRVVEFLQVVDVTADQASVQAVPLRYASAKQLAQTFQALLQNGAPGLGGGVQATNVVADEASNQVILSGSAEAVNRLVELAGKLDVAREAQRTTCFYKLTNTVAVEVLTTLRTMEGDEGFTPATTSGQKTNNGQNGVPAFGQPLPATNFPPAEARPAVNSPETPGNAAADAQASKPIIAADENTNSIIIIATPDQQAMYEPIIQKLDQRRPQVMIETTVVSLDTSNNFTLGVDIGAEFDDGKVITFSSFGISQVNPSTGTLAPVNAPGGTLALLNPDVADVVIRALATNSHSRLVSMPRVLVNDNSTGRLASVQQQPFQRTVVTQSTTIVGEGDNAVAGTTIDVTPHISNGDYLQLEYGVELSSFTGIAQNNLPPPSQKNLVSSKVTIPDGHTIVVGGLNRSDYSETVDSIPILGQIPIIEYLFSNRSKHQNNTTLFVFIRPTILRDDQFRDLKYLSAVDRRAAKIPDDLPTSSPLVIQPSAQ